MSVKFIAIAALGKNREIGLKGHIPWSIPDEYKHYQDTVKDQYVLVGRKNFECHQGDIQGAKPIIMTRGTYHHEKAVAVVSTVTDVIKFAEDHQIKTIYIVGGAEIYNLTLPYLSEFICSIVDYEGPADTYFPEYMFYEWEVKNQEVHDKWSMYHLIKIPDHA